MYRSTNPSNKINVVKETSRIPSSANLGIMVQSVDSKHKNYSSQESTDLFWYASPNLFKMDLQFQSEKMILFIIIGYIVIDVVLETSGSS